MAAAMMLASAVISIVFLFDFTRTLAELHRERQALIVNARAPRVSAFEPVSIGEDLK